jgi:integrase
MLPTVRTFDIHSVYVAPTSGEFPGHTTDCATWANVPSRSSSAAGAPSVAPILKLAEQHPDFRAASFTPHDFLRLLATDLVNNGLHIHIGAALLGHLNLQTTRGYVAVFNEDVVRRYQEFLDGRREARSMDEYKRVTDSEWSEFEEHFDRRKVELGGCARP